MNRIHRSQLREILIQLADLKSRLSLIYWDTGEDITAQESIKIKKAIDELNNTIYDLTGVI